MPHQRFFLFVFLCCSTALCAETEAMAVQQFISRHCVDCHGETEPEGGLRLDNLQLKFTKSEDFQTWVKIHDRVSRGEMPPMEAEQPPTKDKAELLTALGERLRTEDQKQQEQYGRSELRRLNRVEFAHTLRDVLALPHLELEDRLPADALHGGYDKSAAALDFSHVMITRYLETADHALWQALAPTVKSEPKRIVRGELKSVQGVKDTLQTLHVQLKHGNAVPLIGKEIDTTIRTDRGNFKERRPGSVTDFKPYFDGVLTFHEQPIEPQYRRQALQGYPERLLLPAGQRLHDDQRSRQTPARRAHGNGGVLFQHRPAAGSVRPAAEHAHHQRNQSLAQCRGAGGIPRHLHRQQALETPRVKTQTVRFFITSNLTASRCGGWRWKAHW